MDKEINILALSQGSVKDFDILFITYYPKVKSFLLSMLANEEEAEDLAQDTFMRLWQRKELLINVNNLNAYIYQTVKHVLYSDLDRKKGILNTDIESASELLSSGEVEEIVYRHELEDIINKTIDNMPPQRKQVFCMSRRQGLTTEEISHRLGISRRTVETHISIALATLRKVIFSLTLFFNC